MLTILDETVGCLDVGIGWNSSACLSRRGPELAAGRGGNAHRPQKQTFSAADWDKYYGLLEWSGCHWLRLAISLSDWVAGENSFRFDSAEMQRLYAVLDQAEKRGIKVLLANWHLGSPPPATGRPTPQDRFLKNHPENEELFAEALAALVYHLKQEKPYSCVWALSLWNEPNGQWAYTGPQANYPDSFWPLYKRVDSHLRQRGVRKEILLLGPDTSTNGHPYHISQMLKRHGPVLDIVADHDYGAFRGKAMWRSITAYRRLINDLQEIYAQRVPFVISEFGNYGRGADAVDDDALVYSGSLSTVAYLIRMINQGTAGLARWEFLIYGDKWRNFGALTSSDPNYIFRPYSPVFYPHAITARYVRPGWSVCKIEKKAAVGGLWASALTSPQRDALTILLLNDGPKPLALRLILPLALRPAKLHHLRVTPPLGNGIEQGATIALDKQLIEIELPAKSITVLTSLPPGELDRPPRLSRRRTLYDRLHVLIYQLGWQARRLRRAAGRVKYRLWRK